MPKKSLEDIYQINDILEQNRQENALERGRAKGYFNSTPSIGNIMKGIYHYYKSVPGLGGKNENNIIQGGIAPTPGLPAKAKNAAEALKMVQAMKAAKSGKITNTVNKVEKTIQNIESNISPNDWYNQYNLTKTSRVNLDNVLNKLSDTERLDILKVMQQNPEKYLADGTGLFNITPISAASKIRSIRKNLLGNNYTSLTTDAIPIRQNVGLTKLPSGTVTSQGPGIITKRGGKTWATKPKF